MIGYAYMLHITFKLNLLSLNSQNTRESYFTWHRKQLTKPPTPTRIKKILHHNNLAYNKYNNYDRFQQIKNTWKNNTGRTGHVKSILH